MSADEGDQMDLPMGLPPLPPKDPTEAPTEPAPALPAVVVLGDAQTPPTAKNTASLGVPVVGPCVDPAVQLIIDFEESGRVATRPYLDPGGIPTQGYGSIWTWDTAGRRTGRVTMQSPEIDEGTAHAWLGYELKEVMKGIAALVHVPLTANQQAALEDFVYNLGLGNFGGSTLLRKLNAGDYTGAANELDKWTHQGGVELAGLVRRRRVEHVLMETP